MSDDVERKERKARKDGTHFAAFAPFAFPVVLALIFLALHLPYLPASLEDLDSVNFAFGLRHFDVAEHNPHPPGYPLFIVVAKAVRTVVPSETTALGLVSVLAGALGVFAMAALFRRLERDELRAGEPPAWPRAATALATASPLYWFTAARPMSDMTGLAAALAVQVMTLSASSVRALTLAAFAAGLATGLRSQVAWLTVPLICGAALRERRSLTSVLRPLAFIFAAFAAGALLWLVPLVAVSGGPAAYWSALFAQGTEDLGNIQMLWTRHDGRALLEALYYAFVAPWAASSLAAIVLLLSAAGLVRTLRDAPRALAWLAVGYGPYLLFDLLFQETFTSRYALPLVIPMAYLAVSGARLLPREVGLAAAVALVIVCAYAGETSVAAYARQKAPAYRLFDDMRRVMRSTPERPVTAMDRRERLDLLKPLLWAGGLPDQARTLSAPPQHEWLEPVKYWNSGGRAPVWFVVDPKRTMIDLVQHGEPVQYRWLLPYPALLSGVRPDEMDWYRVDRPDWYVGEGWSLTPESAGVAEADRRGLEYGAIAAWVARDGVHHDMLIGGRSFDPAAHPRLTVSVDDVVQDEWSVGPGRFVRFLTPDVIGEPGTYGRVTIRATPNSRVAIEQFDTSTSRTLLAFGEGWHEQEFDPTTGRRWQWMSERGELRFRPSGAAISTRRLALHLEGESPRKYFPRDSRLVVRIGARVVFDAPLSADFSLDIPVNAPVADGTEGVILLETDQVFAPADRGRRSADRRHLGLRIFRCELRTAS